MRLFGVLIVAFVLVLPAPALAQRTIPPELVGSWSSNTSEIDSVRYDRSVPPGGAVKWLKKPEVDTVTMHVTLAADSTYTFVYSPSNGKAPTRGGNGRWWVVADTIFGFTNPACKFVLQNQQLTFFQLAQDSTHKVVVETKPMFAFTHADAAKP